MTFFVDLRQASVGGSVATTPQVYDDALPNLGLTDLVTACAGREILFVAHGFNVDRASGISHLTGWHEALSCLTPDGLPFVFVGILWPGDSRWLPVIDYPFEGDEAIQSGQLLAKFISANLAAAASVSFASHSLGARVILEAVKNFPPPVSRLFMMAGAIEDDCLLNEYQVSAQKTRQISVLASFNDEVLEWAFPAGNFVAEILMRGAPYTKTALGRDGPASPASIVLPGWEIPNAWTYGHGSYLPVGPVAAVTPIPDTTPFPLLTAPGPAYPVPPGAPPEPAWKSMWTAALLLSRW